MKNTSSDLITIIIRSIICGAIITIGAWRVGYGMAFGPDMPQGMENLLSIVIMSVLFLVAKLLPLKIAKISGERWIFHLVTAVCYSLVVTGVLFAFGVFVPDWAAKLDNVTVLPLWQQMAGCFCPLAVIWFVANVIGDSIKGRNKKGE